MPLPAIGRRDRDPPPRSQRTGDQRPRRVARMRSRLRTAHLGASNALRPTCCRRSAAFSRAAWCSPARLRTAGTGRLASPRRTHGKYAAALAFAKDRLGSHVAEDWQLPRRNWAIPSKRLPAPSRGWPWSAALVTPRSCLRSGCTRHAGAARGPLPRAKRPGRWITIPPPASTAQAPSWLSNPPQGGSR